MRTNHIIKTTLSAALLAVTATGFAQQLPGGKVSILNKEVKKTGNNVVVNMDLKVDQLDLKSNRGAVIVPMIVNGDDTLKLPAAEVMGSKRYIYYQRNGKTATQNPAIVEKYKGGEAQTLHYVASTPYQDWMDDSQLVIGQDACGCNQAIVEQGLLQNAGEALAGPMKICYAYVQPKAEPVKARSENGTARLQFNLNKATVNTQLANNKSELEKMRHTIDVVKNDADVKITSITLHGYASPDGSYANNEKLARNRTKAVYDYLKGIYPVEEKLITFSSTAEDWQGVKDYVAKNDIPQKQTVNDIIASSASPDEKEKAIASKAGEAHRYLINNVYPQLRRTEYTVNYEVRNFNLEEARQLVKTQPQKLSLNEMYMVANSYEKGSKDYNELFDVAVKMFPNDELANLNAAYTAIDRGDTVSAEQYLKKAGSSPQTDNALGAVAVLKKDYSTAKSYFQKAADAGLAEAKTNLQELLKRM